MLMGSRGRAALLCAVVVGGILVGAAAAAAEALEVTRLDDPLPGSCEPTDCSLREAIIAANDTEGHDTIVLEAGVTYELTTDGPFEDEAATGDLDITDDLTIQGNGATVDQTISDRVIQVHADATATMNSLDVTGGAASSTGGSGGGIQNSGDLTITSSTISNNAAGSAGGGITNLGDLTIAFSTISDNTTRSGGGIRNSGNLTITSSTISNNTANLGGGGISHVSGATLDSTSTTIANNDTDGSGGGVFFGFAQTATLKATVLADNTANNEGPDCFSSLAPTSEDYNVIEDPSDCDFTPQDNDVTEEDPGLGPLADNGGPTETHAIDQDSVAFNRHSSDDEDCVLMDGSVSDQRAIVRPQFEKCDSGAFEFTPTTLLVHTAGAGTDAQAAEGVVTSEADPEASNTGARISCSREDGIDNQGVCGTGFGDQTSVEITATPSPGTIALIRGACAVGSGEEGEEVSCSYNTDITDPHREATATFISGAPTLTLTLDPEATLDRQGLSVSGTYTCTPEDAEVTLTGEVRQEVRRRTLTASFEVTPTGPCDETTQVWETSDLEAEEGRFTARSTRTTTATVTGVACTEVTVAVVVEICSEEASDDATLTITRGRRR